jgi:predicted RNA-binding protein YlxR (DUF448 family)
MLRLALVPTEADTRVVVDLTGRAPGRGSWVHARPACLRRAAERGLARAARGRVQVDLPSLLREIREAGDRRVEGLLAAARRSGQLALGTTAVERAALQGAVWLCVVASDAAAAARSAPVGRLAAEGRVTVWGTKACLGALRSSDGDVGVLAVLSEGIAREVRSTVALVEGIVEEGQTRSPERTAAHELEPGAAPTSRAKCARGMQRPVTS